MASSKTIIDLTQLKDIYNIEVLFHNDNKDDKVIVVTGYKNWISGYVKYDPKTNRYDQYRCCQYIVPSCTLRYALDPEWEYVHKNGYLLEHIFN